MRQKLRFFILASCLETSIGWADLPLMIQELLIQDHVVRFHVGLNYGNQTRRDVFSLQNQDEFSARIGIRYGLTPTTKIFGRITGSHRENRLVAAASSTGVSATKFNTVVLGINHGFSPDTETPALLGYIEASVIESTRSSNADSSAEDHFVYGRTWGSGLTTYRSFDPVVLSLSVGYDHSQARPLLHNGNHITFDPGDGLYLQPALNFAINDNISVSSGFQVTYNGKNKIDSEPTGISFTRTKATFGIGFAPDEKTAMFFNLSADVSGDAGASIGFHITHDITL